MKLALICPLVIALFLTALFAQDPQFPTPRIIQSVPALNPTIIPPIHFDCVSPLSSTIQIKMDLDSNPFDALRILIANTPSTSTDKTPPVITSVIFTGGSTVLTDAVPIPPTTTSVQFSVTASDDVGVQTFELYVDGFLASPGPAMNYPHFLPSTFAVRWNDNSITPGAHAFRLIAYDQAGNGSLERQWVMVK